MLLKCDVQYVNKFEKLSSSQRTGKGQFSFHSQRRAMPKNAQTTIHLCSFHMLARLCSKSFKLGFNSMWTENFWMYKLDLEKAERSQRSNCQHWSWRRQRSSRNTSASALLTMLKPLTLNHSKIIKRMGVPDHLICLLRKLYVDQEATVRNNGLVQNWEKSTTRLYVVTLLF